MWAEGKEQQQRGKGGEEEGTAAATQAPPPPLPTTPPRGGIGTPDLAPGPGAAVEIGTREETMIKAIIITTPIGMSDTRAIRTGRRASSFPRDAAGRTTTSGGPGVASR